jgi:hypothetical protein
MGCAVMDDNRHLRHFPELDPITATAKDKLRQTLAEQVDAYLAKGGVIQDVGNQSGMIWPVRRDRKSQVNFIKKRDYQATQDRKANKGKDSE